MQPEQLKDWRLSPRCLSQDPRQGLWPIELRLTRSLSLAKPLDHQPFGRRRLPKHQHVHQWCCLRPSLDRAVTPPSMRAQAYLLSSPKLRRPWVRHLPGTAASKGPGTQRSTSSESSLQVLVKTRPKASDTKGKGKDKRTKQGEVLPKDKRELEATSSGQSTESDEGGAVLASSSTTPWQHLEAKDKTREPCPVAGAGDVGMAEASEHPTRPSCSQGGGAPELHGWQQSGLPKSLLKAMPKTLGFEWCPSGPCGTLLQWLGQDRAAYTCQGMVFKISELPQFPELRLSRRFPGVVAKVFWLGLRRSC